MDYAARLARMGDRLVRFVVDILVVAMLLYGGYALWDTAMTYQGAFLDSELMAYKPSGDSTPQGNPSLTQLQEINPDCRGWLTVENTGIDYPVLQGKSDWDYLNTNLYGEFALSGSIFLDSRNSPDFSDTYNVIYGHHMDNGAMFGDVVEFVNRDYFTAHPKGWLYLPGATYEITFFACLQTDAFDQMVYNPTMVEDLSELLSYIREKAVQSREIAIGAGDQIVGLSTCADAQTNGRVIIFGRLERIG